MTYKPKLPIQPDNFNVGVTNTTKVVTAAGGVLTLNLQETNYAIINASSAFQINTPTGGYGSCNLLVDVSSGPITLTLGTNVYTTSSSLSLANGPHILKIAKFSDTETIVTLIYTPITNILAVGSYSSVGIQLYNLDTGDLIFTYNSTQSGTANEIQYSPNKLYIAKEDGKIFDANYSIGTFIEDLGGDNSRYGLCWRNDAQQLAYVGPDTYLLVVDTTNPDPALWTPVFDSTARAFTSGCWAASNTRFLQCHPGQSPYAGKYYRTLYDASTWSTIALPTSGYASASYSCRLSPDGSTIAIGNLDVGATLEFWDVATWTQFVPPGFVYPQGGVHSVYDLDWSADGSMLACVHTSSPFFTVYDTSTWSKISTPSVFPNARGLSCTFTPDGSTLIVGCLSGAGETISFYDTSTWNQITGVLTSVPTHTVSELRLLQRDYV